MKRLILSLSIICSLQAYPAYTQVSTWTNEALDTWAGQRVGMTTAQAETYQTVAMAMEDHPATKMKVKP
jgi:hypothetical protein